MDFIKKIGWILLGIFVAAVSLFSVFLGLGSVAEMVIKIVEIAGGGSIIRGIIMAPFFIFGAIQIFRGACKVFDEDLRKMDSRKDSIWNYFYIPATIIGYIAVIMAVCFWSASV
jgi:hypothetical protein